MEIKTTVTLWNENQEIINTKHFSHVSGDNPDTHIIRIMGEDFKELIRSLFDDQSKGK